MKNQNTIIITTIILMLAIISGCRSNDHNRKLSKNEVASRICSGFQTPPSNKIYLYVSEGYEANKNIVQALQSNISNSLLPRVESVKIINKDTDAHPDGLLLKIYVTNTRRFFLTRRIDVKFELINPLSKRVVSEGKEASKSRFGFNKITKTLGKRVAKRIDPTIKCFNIQRNK